ncbi:MAG: hypothetical protein M1816_000854 [Peltula sp. TS41687]|nr:MAG: hypothetical protein M1816_000854 [Peltula sp. TS41687]
MYTRMLLPLLAGLLASTAVQVYAAPMTGAARLQPRQDDDPIGKIVDSVGNAVLGAVASKVLEPTFDAIGPALGQAAQEVGQAASDTIDAVGSAAQAAGDAAGEAIDQFGNAIVPPAYR